MPLDAHGPGELVLCSHSQTAVAFGLLDNLSSRDFLQLNGSLMIQNIELLWTYYVKVEMLPI